MAEGHRVVAAVAAAVCALTGAVGATVAVVAGPGPGLTGYVSEAGVVTSPYSGLYRLGVFVMAAGLALLAVALPRPARYAIALLVVSAGNTLVSGAVRCTDGCPLPPFEAPTVADLVHGAASVVAAGTCVLAMLALVFSWHTPPGLRRVSVAAAVVAVPLGLLVAVGMLVLGRGTAVGVIERLFLANAVLWVTVGSGTLAAEARTRDELPDDSAVLR